MLPPLRTLFDLINHSSIADGTAAACMAAVYIISSHAAAVILLCGVIVGDCTYAITKPKGLMIL